MPPFTTICQSLVQRARNRPDEIALVGRDGNETNAAGLVTSLARFATVLGLVGVRRGLRVGVECPDREMHLLLLLACQALGACTVSFGAAELREDGDLMFGCDLILCTAPAPKGPMPSVVLSPDWLRQAWAIPADALDRSVLESDLPPDHPVRIVRTSGSMGARKAVVIPAACQRARVTLKSPRDPSLPPMRHVSLYQMTFEGEFNRCCVVLLLGGQVVFSRRETFFDDIARHDGNSTLLLVGEIEALVAQWTSERTRPALMAVTAVGDRLPAALRRNLLAGFATDVNNSYSANEAGVIAQVDAQGLGVIAPGVEVGIRDQAGSIQPDTTTGAEGLISVRSSTVASGYLDNPEASALVFADGWFHTSDWGFKPDPAHLVVLGRADGLLNIGGRKIPAERIEAELRDLDGVADAAMVSVPGVSGVPHLAVMLELRPGASYDLVSRAAHELLSRRCTCAVALVRDLPRTETGKVRRGDVIEWFRAHDAGGAT